MNENIFNLINLIKSQKDPQQFVINMLKEQHNPVLDNLLGLAQNNKQNEVENIVRNIFKENGRDFDKEFSMFKNIFKF